MPVTKLCRDRPLQSSAMTPPPSVVLFWGEDPFLLRLAALTLLEERGVEATEVDGNEWTGGETSDLATPSLWGDPRVLLVSHCQDLPDSGSTEIGRYLEAPAPDALLVLTQAAKGRQGPPLARRVQASGGLVRHVAVGKQELGKWIEGRARVRGVQLTGPGASALVGIIGEHTAMLDQAVEQLASAFPHREVGPAEVRSQFRGLGEQRVWDLCDQALTGRLGPALVTLRGLLEGRDDPLMILGVIAARVRDLVRVRELPDRMPAAEAARASGLRFDWQVRRYREQAARFSREELARLHHQVVAADRALKGGVPGDVLLPSLVGAMAGQPEAALDVPIRVSR
jgi:DNA polymerase III subunit delta